MSAAGSRRRRLARSSKGRQCAIDLSVGRSFPRGFDSGVEQFQRLVDGGLRILVAELSPPAMSLQRALDPTPDRGKRRGFRIGEKLPKAAAGDSLGNDQSSLDFAKGRNGEAFSASLAIPFCDEHRLYLLVPNPGQAAIDRRSSANNDNSAPGRPWAH